VNDQAADARYQLGRAVSGMTGGGPLAVLGALTSLRGAALQMERDAARLARQNRRSWDEIAQAMGLAPGPARHPAAEAFSRLASDLGDDRLSFGWPCRECGKVVLDYGPGAGHPADAERGHAEGCTRLAAAVRAYEGSGDAS